MLTTPFGNGVLPAMMDTLTVAFGKETTRILPGHVSTEVDARLSFDAGATVRRAREIARLYADAGVGRDRILIKVAATWEGV